MARRPNNLIPLSRDYRRPPRWNMGGPRGPTPPRRRRTFRDPRVWLKLVIVLAGLGLVVVPYGTDAVGAVFGPKNEQGCRIVTVIDGDTVTLWCPGRGLMKTRLKGFDTPEVFSPRCISEWTSGTAATWHLRRILFGADKITVGFSGTDRYGRQLASLAADGRSVAGRMVAEGYARPYDGGQREEGCNG